MAEYIEREEAINACFNGWNSDAWDCADNIRKIPAADVRPVVRCKDCKYRHDDDFCGGRGWPGQLVPDDGFCDKGARKDREWTLCD